VGARFLHSACQGAIRPSAPRQLRPWVQCFRIADISETDTGAKFYGVSLCISD